MVSKMYAAGWMLGRLRRTVSKSEDLLGLPIAALCIVGIYALGAAVARAKGLR
jgi:hypothetical protein